MGKRKGTSSAQVGGSSRAGEGYEATASDTENTLMVDMDQVTLDNIFNRLDTNHDGYIERNELRTRIQETSLPNELSNKQLQTLFRIADQNQDGQMSRDEFKDFMNSPEVPKSWKDRIVNAGRGYVKWVVPPPVGAEDSVDHPTEYLDEFNCNPPPIFIILISIVELGVFIYYGMTLGGVTASGPIPFDSPLIYDPYRRYEAWRFLSYMLIHAGYMHITFNLLMQLLLGIPLEMVHKWWRVAILYFAGVIAGSLGTSISDPTVYLAGASAGDYAIITAHLATVIMNWKEMALPWLQLLFFVIIIGTDVGVAVYNRYAVATGPKTGYSAHLAGAIAGLLVGIGVLRNLRVRPWEKKLWWASLILYATLMIIAIIWNGAFPDYFPPSKFD